RPRSAGRRRGRGSRRSPPRRAPCVPSCRIPSWATPSVHGVDARVSVSPYPFADAARLSAELGCSHVLAQVLVRRGLGNAMEARRFLAADVAYGLDEFPGLREAAGDVLSHIARGSRITVHGDYDVDGMCATAVLVRALRSLGADVDWYLPS